MRRHRHHTVHLLSFVLFALIGSTFLAGYVSPARSGGIIPEDAIRIRIIAASDSPSDQAVKLKVRDAVAAYIESWGAMPATRDEARELIASRLQAIGEVANRALAEAGAEYGAQAELAKVPFPAKLFDGRRYAAGDYEALRITLGEGAGSNWWCVLFPPLCLTAATADASAKSADAQPAEAVSAAADEAEPKAKFFLWELLEKLIAFVKELFA